MELGPAPRKHAPPQAVYPRRLMGVWGAIAPPGQFRAGFSEQFNILARKDEPTPDYAPDYAHGIGVYPYHSGGGRMVNSICSLVYLQRSASKVWTGFMGHRAG